MPELPNISIFAIGSSSFRALSKPTALPNLVRGYLQYRIEGFAAADLAVKAHTVDVPSLSQIPSQ